MRKQKTSVFLKQQLFSAITVLTKQEKGRFKEQHETNSVFAVQIYIAMCLIQNSKLSDFGFLMVFFMPGNNDS